MVQPSAMSGRGHEVSHGLESRLSSQQGRGSSLSDADRQYFEPTFGVDFGNVRIHKDSSSDTMNKELNAHAFTFGSDIYFGAGQGNSETFDGRKLLAHELTHVVQQRGDLSCKRIQLQPVVSSWTFKNRGNTSPDNLCQWCTNMPLGVLPQAGVNAMELCANISGHETGYQYRMRQKIVDHRGRECVSGGGCTVKDSFSNRPDNPRPQAVYADTGTPPLASLFSVDRPGWPDPRVLRSFPQTVTDVTIDTSFRNWIEITDPQGYGSTHASYVDWHNKLWFVRDARSSIGFRKDMSRSEIERD